MRRSQSEVGFRVDSVQFCGAQQTIDRRDPHGCMKRELRQRRSPRQMIQHPAFSVAQQSRQGARVFNHSDSAGAHSASSSFDTEISSAFEDGVEFASRKLEAIQVADLVTRECMKEHPDVVVHLGANPRRSA